VRSAFPLSWMLGWVWRRAVMGLSFQRANHDVGS
jgi:hypothetical protein